MAQVIARIQGIITMSKLENPASDLKERDPEKWVKLKNEGNLPDPFYSYSIDQHTGDDKPFQLKIKDYDTTKPMCEPFTMFDSNCVLTSWAFNNRHGFSAKPTDSVVRQVSMSFTDEKNIPLGKKSA